MKYVKQLKHLDVLLNSPYGYMQGLEIAVDSET